MPFATTADLHLSPRTWAKHPGLEGDSYYSFEQIGRYCVEQNMPLMLLGDILDRTRPDPKTVFMMNRVFDDLEWNEVPVYYNQGNHEKDEHIPWLSAVHTWPIPIHRKSFEIGGVRLYGLDWTHNSQIIQELDIIPAGTDVLLAHQAWKDIMGSRADVASCSFSDVPVVKMLITGDFHKHMVLKVTNKDKNEMTVLSPGSTCMQAINEDSRKFFYVVNDDLNYKSVDIRNRNCFRYIIHTKQDLEDFLKQNLTEVTTLQENVPEYIAKNIVHITYDEELPEVYDRITKSIGNKAHCFLVPIKRETETVTIEIEKRRALADGGLEACLELLVKKDEKIYKDALMLLTDQDPKARLDVIYERFMKSR